MLEVYSECMISELIPPEFVVFAQESSPVVSALTIILIGYIVEKHYVSRPALAANGGALSLYYLNFLIPNSGFFRQVVIAPDLLGRTVTPWLFVELYVVIGAFIGVYALISYQTKSRNSPEFYEVSKMLYNSVLVGLVISATFLMI